MGRFKNVLNFMKEILCVLLLLISLTSFSQELQSPDRILTYGFPYDTQRKAIKFVGKNGELNSIQLQIVWFQEN
jgi:hypothetical protein